MGKAQASHHHHRHIIMLTTPGLGHVIPFLELARKLIEKHSFNITMIMPSGNAPSSSTERNDGLVQSNPNLKFVYLPPVKLDDLPKDAKLETRIISGVARSIPALRKVLEELNESRTTVVSAVVVDLFCTNTFDMVQELGIPKYVYTPSSAMVLSATFYLPELDKTWTGEYRDLPEPVKFMGCTVPVRGSDFTEWVQNRNDEAYELALELSNKYASADGLIINNFLDLEPETFEVFNQLAKSGSIPPVYPVGPLTRSGSTRDGCDHPHANECLKWLDDQPLESVLFVSFGSGGTLSTKQLNHLAMGLEMSRQRFLLMVKRPNDESRNAAYFGDQNDVDPYEFLPGGFKERNQGTGFVLAEWAPQIEILAHGSVGGFLTHCGWNSTLESIVHGVPLIAWPLYAEQKMNAVLLSEALKVAIRVKEDGEDGVVGCEQISKVVRDLIEGDEGKAMRKRMRDLKDSADRALKEDGSSTKALAEVAERWISNGN